MTTVALFIFLLTYLLIASRRLALLPIGRPAGALLGALLMVATGVLSPIQSYRAIDCDTILLLFSMMVLTAYMERSGLFRYFAAVLGHPRWSPLQLLYLLVFLAGMLSALLVNDTICLVLTPLIIAVCRQRQLPMGPYLMALATSANIGSAGTLVGNPQNMIIGSLSRLGFTPFLLRAGPPALIGLGLNALVLHAVYRRGLRRPHPVAGPSLVPRAAEIQTWLPAVVGGGVALGFLAGLHLGYTSLAGAMVLMLADRREPTEIFSRLDWPLLVFFCSLFIVVAGLAKTGLIEQAWHGAAPQLALDSAGGLVRFSLYMVLGSNIFSNVPMVLLTAPQLPELGALRRGWVLMGFVTTIAGNLTLLGSVANIIVAERAKLDYNLTFWEYLRVGLLSTLVVLGVGVPLVAVLTRGG